VAVYPYDIAETKSVEATEVARSNSYPLKVSIEQE
jgi:ATP-dependent Clp protease adapter protein ClpS